MHLVARPGEGAGGEVEHFVRSGAVDDPRRIEAVFRRDRLAQLGRAGIGIALERWSRRPGTPRALPALVPSGFSLDESLATLRPSSVVERPGT